MKRYDRRTFLKLSGASAVMLALAGCEDECFGGSGAPDIPDSGSSIDPSTYDPFHSEEITTLGPPLPEAPESPPIPVIRDGRKIFEIINAELTRRKVQYFKLQYNAGLEHSIGFTAIPRRLWGTYRAGDESANGIRWMTFLPDGSCYMSVECVGWNGILTGTAEGTQGRTEDGTELHFTLTDTDGRPCEFWAILLNDDGSPSGCSLKYRAGEQLFDRDTRPIYWKNDSPDLTLVP